MAVTLTEAAAKHVAAYLAKRGKGIGLRLGVKTSGCSGMAYKLEFADAVNDDDQMWESHGVKLRKIVTDRILRETGDAGNRKVVNLGIHNYFPS